MRSERNWEAEFRNITYANALKIKQDENIKEISIIHNIGKSEENFGSGLNQIGGIERIVISAYEKNALKNNQLTVLEGRLPTNTSEIVLSDAMRDRSEHLKNINIGEELKVTIDGEKKAYKVVGIVESLISDIGGFASEYVNGAITYYDEKQITDETIVDVTIITNDIHKIYKTTNKLASTLKLYETKEEQDANISYYTKLLNYSLVNGENLNKMDNDRNSQKFGNTIFGIELILITIIGIVSVIVIFSTFKITYSERIREISYFDKLSNGYFMEDITWMPLLINSSIKFRMVFPLKSIILSIVLAYIIAIISGMLPIRKINKQSPIEDIRKNQSSNIKSKLLKTPKYIYALFKQEGELAYKFIRSDKSRYKAIIISIVVSIVLFLTITRLLDFKGSIPNIKSIKTVTLEIKKNDDDGKTNIENTHIVMNYLQEKGLVDDYLYINQVTNDLSIRAVIPKDKIADGGKKLYDNNVITLYEDEKNYLCDVLVWIASGTEYEEILKGLKIEKLNKGECIVLNTIFDTRYGKRINISNYKPGDSISLKETESNNKAELINIEEFEGELPDIFKNIPIDTNEVIEEEPQNKFNLLEYNLKIAGILENSDSKIRLADVNFPFIVLINEDTLEEWCKRRKHEIRTHWLCIYSIM